MSANPFNEQGLYPRVTPSRKTPSPDRYDAIITDPTTGKEMFVSKHPRTFAGALYLPTIIVIIFAVLSIAVSLFSGDLWGALVTLIIYVILGFLVQFLCAKNYCWISWVIVVIMILLALSIAVGAFVYGKVVSDLFRFAQRPPLQQ